MATLATAARNAGIAAIGVLMNSGHVQFQTAANSPVATCNFGSTAFGAPATGVITANAIADDTNAAGGVIDHAILQSSANATEITLTCTAVGGGGEIELTSLTIGAGDTLSLTSLTLTQPAS